MMRRHYPWTVVGCGRAPPAGVVLCSLMIASLTACGDGNEATVAEPPAPPRAAAISVSPESIELDFIGATATLSATVTDQYGAAYNSGTVAWTSSSPSVFGVDARGVVTAVSTGSGWARAVVDGVSDSASVAVVQVPGAMNLQSGDAQEGLPGTALAHPIVVGVVDRGGSPVAGARVSFTPSTDHGSVAPDSASTDDSGNASTIWTLGAEIGPQLLTATESGGHKVEIKALGTTGSSMEVVSGARQRALPGQSLQEPIVVRVLDSRGEPFAGTTVVFMPEQSHGNVSPDSARTDANGEAAANWTLGDNTGAQTLAAYVRDGPSIELKATGLTGLGICDRTPEVRQAVMWAVRVHDCASVTDDHLRRITSLTGYLSDRGIAALYHDDFEGLINLESLDLRGNKLRDLPSGLFASLKSLKRLDISSGVPCMPPETVVNCIEQLPADIFAGLSNLEYLSLAKNRLRSLPAGVFAGLARLRTLSLTFNRLETLPVGVFADLLGLQSLWLGANRLQTLQTGVFDGLTNLRSLGIGSNSLEVLPSRLFSDLSALEELSLAFNRIHDLRPMAMTGMSNLRRLNLDGNALRDIPNNAWSGLPRLSRLRLFFNSFSHLDAAMFSGLERLDSLWIGNDVASIDAGFLSALPDIEYLWLGVEGFSALSRSPLASSSLELLFVEAWEPTNTTLRSGMFSGLSRLAKLGIISNVSRGGGSAHPTDFAGSGFVERRTVLEPVSRLVEPEAEPTLQVVEDRRQPGRAGFAGVGRASALTRLPDGLLSGLEQLENLWIWIYTDQVALSEQTFAGLRRLKSIWLDSQGLAPVPSRVFSELEGLEYLTLRHVKGGYPAVGQLPDGLFDRLTSLRTLSLSQGLTYLQDEVFSDLVSLRGLYLYYNQLASLPDGVFRGLHDLSRLDLTLNPGTPFRLLLSAERSDTADLAAPGPASVVVTLAEGAPDDITVTLAAPGATLSSSTAVVERGRVRSDPITVTRDSSHQGSVVIRLVDPSALHSPRRIECVRETRCYYGVYVAVGDSLKLFR